MPTHGGASSTQTCSSPLVQAIDTGKARFDQVPGHRGLPAQVGRVCPSSPASCVRSRRAKRRRGRTGVASSEGYSCPVQLDPGQTQGGRDPRPVARGDDVRPADRRRRAGGVGYLLKDRVEDLDDFADAIRRIAKGGSVEQSFVPLLGCAAASRSLPPNAAAPVWGSASQRDPRERDGRDAGCSAGPGTTRRGCRSTCAVRPTRSRSQVRRRVGRYESSGRHMSQAVPRATLRLPGRAPAASRPGP
jgi:hypothetical protein